MNKPTKPSVTLPSSFGGQKENFTSSKIENGYEPDIKDILGGANLNYLLDTSGKNFEYLRTIVDFINDMPIDKTITVDSNNNLIYRDWLGGRNFGELVYSSIPLTDSSLKLLDGSILQGDGIYKNFVNYVAGLVNTYPSIFTTETNWQNTVSQYGVCGKFVYDSVNNTVRLPKITGIIEGTTNLNALGDIVQAGLPNITGNTGAIRGAEPASAAASHSTGAFSGTSQGSNALASYSPGSIDNTPRYTFNASYSNAIYGRSSTVQPQTIKCFVYMVVANGVKKTDEELDIDEIIADLNNKAETDFTNVNNTGTSTAAGWAMPSGTYIDLNLGASGSQYTAPANGWLKLTLSLNTKGYIGIGGVFTQNGEADGAYNSVLFPLRKNQTVTIAYANMASKIEFKFVYAQGSESEV